MLSSNSNSLAYIFLKNLSIAAKNVYYVIVSSALSLRRPRGHSSHRLPCYYHLNFSSIMLLKNPHSVMSRKAQLCWRLFQGLLWHLYFLNSFQVQFFGLFVLFNSYISLMKNSGLSLFH